MSADQQQQPYVDALAADVLFADPAYQRDVDPKRVKAMAAAFDRRLLGVIDVSARDDGRYAILDGQHRHALVLEVLGPVAMVCQVYEGLTVEDEARLFHEINVKRKPLNYWDQWKARRAAGDQDLARIEEVLARYQLKVDPTAADGNVNATAALEVITNQIGDLDLLDRVLDLLTATFGRNRDAFSGRLLKAVAMVLAVYPPAELDTGRLRHQLAGIAPRQLLARGAAMRELHSGTIDRLIAAVIVEQYNRGGGRRVQGFLDRVPADHAKVRVHAQWRGRQSTSTGGSTPCPPAEGGSAAEAEVSAAPSTTPAPTPSAPAASPADEGPICANCAHGRSDHMLLIPQCSAPRCTCLRFVADQVLGAVR